MQKGVQTDATCNIQIRWELLVNNVASVCTGLQIPHLEIRDSSLARRVVSLDKELYSALNCKFSQLWEAVSSLS